MKGLSAITIGLVLVVGVLGLSGQALAGVESITNPNNYFFLDDITTFKLTNYESAFTDGWSDDPSTWTPLAADAQIRVGDFLRGIFRITNSQDSTSADLRFADGFELTGEFSGQVSSVTASGGGNALFELIPDSLFEAEYGTGAMVAFFNDSTEDFTGQGTLTSTRDSAVGGTEYLVLGAPSGGVWGTDYFWNANGNQVPGVSTFAASLDVLVNNTSFNTGAFRVLTQDPAAGGAASLGDIENYFALQGNTLVNTTTNSPWALISQDPLRANVVPVPAAGMLGAVMLLGMLGLRLRKSRRQA